METLGLNDLGAAAKAAAVLRSGGVILYPTDTLYGLGADALDDDAVAKIYAIKGREEGKPIHAVFSDMAMVEQYALIDDLARKLAERFLPGPLTLVLQKKEGIEGGIAKNMQTIGVRIPKNDLCLALAREFGKPYTTTSANKSGAPSARRVTDILAQLGPAAEQIDLVVDAGEIVDAKPSTVVDVSSGKTVILREGAIPKDEIELCIRGI